MICSSDGDSGNRSASSKDSSDSINASTAGLMMIPGGVSAVALITTPNL
jgi:hypothetical protein